MKTALVLTTALVLASPFAMAEEKKPAPAAATKTDAAKSHQKQSASDRLAAKQLTASGTARAALGAAGNKPETRDWAAIDGNRDNLVSPEEMEKYLAASWAAKDKK